LESPGPTCYIALNTLQKKIADKLPSALRNSVTIMSVKSSRSINFALMMTRTM